MAIIRWQVCLQNFQWVQKAVEKPFWQCYNPATKLEWNCVYFFKILSQGQVYWFLERGKGRERNINWLLLTCALTRDKTCIVGMCLDQESNLGPFGLQDDTPTSGAKPGRVNCVYSWLPSSKAFPSRSSTWPCTREGINAGLLAGECVLPVIVQTSGQHSELTGNPSRRGDLLCWRHLAWSPRCWLFFSGHSHAWEKAPHHNCRPRGGRGEWVNSLNSATLAERVLRKPVKVTSLTRVLYSLPNLSKGLGTSIYTLRPYFFCPSHQFFCDI